MGQIVGARGANWIIRICAALALVAGLLAGVRPARAEGTVCYVDTSATGDNTGASWENAYLDLQAALANGACDQVWVAEGVYKPTTSDDQTISFNIPPGKQVYGGFAGGETALSQQDVKNNPTILSGDIDNNDTDADLDHVADTVADLQGDNSYHVVYMNGAGGSIIDNTTVVDGFTITAGDTNEYSSHWVGGGLYCNGHGEGSECSPTLRHLTFSGNRAYTYGGAIFNDGYMGASSPIIRDSTFLYNDANMGGAIFNEGRMSGTSSPEISGVTFDHNHAGSSGGAVFNYGSDGGYSHTRFSNVTFHANSASFGGAVANDSNNWGVSSPVYNGVTFFGNSASEYGGATYSMGTTGIGHLSEFTNVILWGNTATTAGAQVYDVDATSNVFYSVVEGGCASVPSGWCTSSVLASDPLLSALADNGGFTQTMALQSGSPAIDAGVDTIATPLTDQRGVGRPQGAASDPGAYEYPGAPGIAGTTWVAGVTLSYEVDSSPMTVVSDSEGRYAISVPSGWSGTVTPSLAGCVFTPLSKDYDNVTLTMPNQDYSAVCTLSFRSSGANDGWVLESGETTGKGGSKNAGGGTIYVGDNATDWQYRGILSFATGGIPDRATISSATLKIKQQGVTGKSPFLTHGSLLADVKKGNLGKASLELTDFQVLPSLKAALTIPNVQTEGWYSVTLGSEALEFISNEGNTQFRLRFTKDDNNDNGADYMKFHSGNASGDDRPVLEIEFQIQ